MTLKAILKNKTATVISVLPGDTIAAVVKVLGEKRIGAVMVIDESETLVGILSERDIVKTLAVHAAETLNLTASVLMTKNPTVTSQDISVERAMEIMSDGRFRHLPVLEGTRVIGLVSIGDVVKARIDQQAHEVDSLRAYVVGSAA